MKAIKMLLKLLRDAIFEMNWTLSGTILVLITLSGDTKDLGLKLFIVSVVIGLVQVMYGNYKESKEKDEI
jgi:type IV secretory pathway TrbL component